HLIVLVADHGSEMSFVDQLHRLDPEARTENAIECGRCTTTLQMPEHAGARFFARTQRNFTRHDDADATEAKFSFLHIAFHLLSMARPRTFRHHHKRTRIARRVAPANG